MSQAEENVRMPQLDDVRSDLLIMATAIRRLSHHLTKAERLATLRFYKHIKAEPFLPVDLLQL